jgi:hypothetical protein
MSDPVRFTFAAAEPDALQVKVYLPQELREDFTEFMESQGVRTSLRIEAAFGVDDAIIGLVGAAGGLGGLAKVLRVYFDRHKNKRVVVKSGDLEVDLSGMSPDEMEDALGGVLDEVAEQQRKADESWHRVQQEMPDPPKQLPSETNDSEH